ncbi:MAG TPA: hypothetical protein VIE46_02720 [Gemmatimonadales bacterium]|jgi:hypothetical protein
MRAAARLTILFALAFVVGPPLPALGQTSGDAGAARPPRRLFRDDAPVALTLAADFRALFSHRDTVNPVREPARLTFPGDSGPVTIAVELSTRGHFRLKPSTCSFAPLKVYFPKDQLKGTLFGGQSSLKLITHCDKSPRYEQNLLVEYGTYRAYNQLTDMSHRARLARITYADTRDSTRTITRDGFFLEADKEMAERNGARVLEHAGGSYSEMDSAQMDLMSVFEWLIGNTDWSVIMNHNVRLLEIPSRQWLYPVAYDFDFSGLVNAPYAVPDSRLPIKNVRQRLYRGMCRPPDVMASTLARFMARQDAIYAAFRTLPDLDPKRLKEATDYLKDGFGTLAKIKDFMPEQDYSCARAGH